MFEVNFDGLVGPWHNYAGLSFGNVASLKNRSTTSHPKMAALQGLQKMKFLLDRGFRQCVLPPQERPRMDILRSLGLQGRSEDLLAQAARTIPEALVACYSASSMWAANCGIFTPSCDTIDGKSHFTPANLSYNFHRSLEAVDTARIFKKILSGPNFVHHPPLPATRAYEDEGSANHTRLCFKGSKGLHFFVYGRYAFRDASGMPTRYPARQTFDASKAICMSHKIPEAGLVLGRQSALAIDAGAFHNDVVAVGNENVFLYHQHSYSHSGTVIEQLTEKFKSLTGHGLKLIEVQESELPLRDAVSSYFFNCQLLTKPDGKMLILAPKESEGLPCIQRILAQDPINEIVYLDVRESMRNGGGPACLRLRVVLSESDWAQVHKGVIFSERLYAELKSWVERNYRDDVTVKDLFDPKFLLECRKALDELTGLLNLGNQWYRFQSSIEDSE